MAVGECPLVPDLRREVTLDDHGVEFFVHSPFATRQDDNELEIRNDDALVMQATFRVDGVLTKVLLFADINYDVIGERVSSGRSLIVARAASNQDFV